MTLKVFNERDDFSALRQCIANGGKSVYNEDNLRIFLSQDFTFFVAAVDENDADSVFGFCYGYILPSPENVTPTVYVKALEIMNGCENKGIGKYILQNLISVFFYEKPYSHILMILNNEQKSLELALNKFYANKLDKNKHGIYILANPNTDENGEWLGVSKVGVVKLEVRD